MKRLIRFILVVFLSLYYAPILEAAMSDDITSQEDIVEQVVEAREKAKNEYHVYVLEKKKEIQRQTPARPAITTAAKHASPYAQSKKDMIIGIAFLIAAIILCLKLYRLSKIKKAG